MQFKATFFSFVVLALASSALAAPVPRSTSLVARQTSVPEIVDIGNGGFIVAPVTVAPPARGSFVLTPEEKAAKDADPIKFKADQIRAKKAEKDAADAVVLADLEQVAVDAEKVAADTKVAAEAAVDDVAVQQAAVDAAKAAVTAREAASQALDPEEVRSEVTQERVDFTNLLNDSSTEQIVLSASQIVSDDALKAVDDAKAAALLAPNNSVAQEAVVATEQVLAEARAVEESVLGLFREMQAAGPGVASLQQAVLDAEKAAADTASLAALMPAGLELVQRAVDKAAKAVTDATEKVQEAQAAAGAAPAAAEPAAAVEPAVVESAAAEPTAVESAAAAPSATPLRRRSFGRSTRQL